MKTLHCTRLSLSPRVREESYTHKHTDVAPGGGLGSQAWLSLRTTPIWPIPRSTLEYRASSRLRELATPKVRNNIWSIHMSEVGALLPLELPSSPRGLSGSGRTRGNRCVTASLNHRESPGFVQEKALLSSPGP